jgi:hypothetical protein
MPTIRYHSNSLTIILKRKSFVNYFFADFLKKIIKFQKFFPFTDFFEKIHEENTF